MSISVAASGLDEAAADAADGAGMLGDGGVTDIFAGAGIASRGRRRGGARRGVVVANHPATDPVQQMLNGDDATVLDRMRRNARRALRAGITTVRDLGDRDYLALSLRDCDPAVRSHCPRSSPPDRQSPRPEGTAGSLAGRPTGSRASPARSPSGPNSGSTS